MKELVLEISVSIDYFHATARYGKVVHLCCSYCSEASPSDLYSPTFGICSVDTRIYQAARPEY